MQFYCAKLQKTYGNASRLPVETKDIMQRSVRISNNLCRTGKTTLLSYRFLKQ
jgi:hypothetical protein